MEKRIGRPSLTQEQKTIRQAELLQKIEPYLKTGLSVNKALRLTHIANSEFYRYMEESDDFKERIQTFRHFVSVLVNNALVRELMVIVEKQNGNLAKGLAPQLLSSDDRKFLFQFALKSNLCKEEWGDRDRVQSFDPEYEIQRVKLLIDQSTTPEIQEL